MMYSVEVDNVEVACVNTEDLAILLAKSISKHWDIHNEKKVVVIRKDKTVVWGDSNERKQ